MVHSSLNWTGNRADGISLRSFAIKHAVWLHNRLPNYCSGIKRLEFLTNNKAGNNDLSRSHVWVCPVFVLEPKLQIQSKDTKVESAILLRTVTWFFRTALFINYKFPPS